MDSKIVELILGRWPLARPRTVVAGLCWWSARTGPRYPYAWQCQTEAVEAPGLGGSWPAGKVRTTGDPGASGNQGGATARHALAGGWTIRALVRDDTTLEN